jgi:hypothetical protein
MLASDGISISSKAFCKWGSCVVIEVKPEFG